MDTYRCSCFSLFHALLRFSSPFCYFIKKLISESGPSLLTGFLGGLTVSSMPLLAFAAFHVFSLDLISFPLPPYRAHLLNLRGRWSGESGANREPSRSPPGVQLPLGPTRLRPRPSPGRWHRRVWSNAQWGRSAALLPSESPNARFPHGTNTLRGLHLSGCPRLGAGAAILGKARGSA